MKSAVQYQDKIKLLNWLVDNNHVTKLPVTPINLLCLIRQSDEKSGHIERYLQKIPNWFAEQDSNGNNILHYATRHQGVRVVTLNRIMRLIKKHCFDTQN
eukprot:TRINITY_DN10376_c0_g1_i1.p1 TRINITY_DN10376_c0_g1~~TRINITY_DN10376_c0_g1_i1.p1  ORF type:complete len:115 (-),score=8.35 TRINITY_DN10376_c0_g1_i1:174-473(-)